MFHIDYDNRSGRHEYHGSTHDAILLPASDNKCQVYLHAGSGNFEITGSSQLMIEASMAQWHRLPEDITGPWQSGLESCPQAIRFVGDGEFSILINAVDHEVTR